MKESHEVTWEELITEASRDIHSGLLEGGGKGMKAAVHWAMERAIQWHMAVTEHEKKMMKLSKMRKGKW